MNIYSHITDTMQQQAAVRIDCKIGGTNAEMPEPPPPKVSDEPSAESATETIFEPYKPKIRKIGTGCVTMINDHLYEGRFTPRTNGKRISKNVYAKTREECEEKLAGLNHESGNRGYEKTSEERITHRGATTSGRSPLQNCGAVSKEDDF